MKKRMTELENQIAIQSEKYKNLSKSSNQKEEQLNNNITEYINQINDLKNEMEVLNNIITNLTEEKENNAIKITNLLQENEKLKKDIKNNDDKENTNNSKITETPNNKRYEEIILKLKKNLLNLKEEKKALEEVILKQENEVNQLSSKVLNVEKILIKKNKELEDSIEYSAKLTSSINFQKNEILKLKQKQSQSDNNKNDKNSETIINLQNELQNMRNNLEAKESKLNSLKSNNKTLQDKLNKLTIAIKNEFNNNNGNNSKYNNKNKNNIYNSYSNNHYSNKIVISKPQSQLKNKTSRIPGGLNPISSNILPKNNIDNNNIENFKDNYKNNQLKNIDDKKLYIISKHKIKSKTPGKLINTKHQLPDPKPYINKQNDGKSDNNLVNICPNIFNPQKNTKNYKLNIEEKYKQIESKYKDEKKEISKEDTLFNEEDINNIKKDIITPSNHLDEDFDYSNPVFNNINVQIMKSKKEGRNILDPIYKKNIDKVPNKAKEKEFPIIESYCMIYDKDNQNKSGSNCITNENKNSKDITINNDKERSNESKLDAKHVQDVNDYVNKILNDLK